jgi:hypothetical protein
VLHSLGKFIQTESILDVTKSGEKRKMRSYPLMATKFLFEDAQKRKKKKKTLKNVR